ncbi:MAG TPA: hypothetical protein VKW04_18935 [Planctomycetota bacterium]|nr:hypothetical protein [Planctomycetota bacterium]
MTMGLKGLVLLAVLSPTGRENPEYTWWSSFNPGAWAKIRMEGIIEDRPFTLEQTQTLVAVSPEKVQVSRRGTLQIGGALLPGTKERDEVAREDDLALTITAEGDETIVAAGIPLQSHRIEGTDPRTKARVKFWIVKDVPGGVVRGELCPEGSTSVTTITLVSWGRR